MHRNEYVFECEGRKVFVTTARDSYGTRAEYWDIVASVLIPEGSLQRVPVPSRAYATEADAVSEALDAAMKKSPG